MSAAKSEQSWQDKAQAKRDAVIGLIPQFWRVEVPASEAQRDVTGDHIRQYLSPREIEITETDAVGIVAQTTSGKWTAEEVTLAFAHRAALAHQLVNCLHEIFFDAAIEDAKKLDTHFAEHKKPVGPLHGLPVSLKDQFHVKGVETHMGYVGWIGTFQGKKGTGREKVFESEMVREFRNLGAVLYCKTSVPHTLMTGETVNNIIGYTWNPKNRNLASGGSSGGEGALIGLRGSPLGFGTDIGGSIRIPAAFNGLYGVRPSTGRMPYEGMANSLDGQNSVLSVVGPLATSVGSLRLALKSLLSQQPWLYDPLVHEIPWRDEQEKQVHDIIGTSSGGLVFGVIKNDGHITPYPPVQRAIETTIKALKAKGHKVIEWDASSHLRARDLVNTIWNFDGGVDVATAFALSNEPPSKQVEVLMGPVEALSQAKNAVDIAAVNITKREFQKEYMDRWNATKDITGTGRPIDAIISPVAPFPAARPTRYTYYSYSTWVNLLDYSSCVVPVTTVDKSVDGVIEDFKPLSDEDKEIMADYDPEIYDGAHVAVQIVGRRLQEEKVLAIAEHVASALAEKK